jgi:hypothetical protein
MLGVPQATSRKEKWAGCARATAKALDAELGKKGTHGGRVGE